MNKDLMITQQDLVDWIDRPPSNDDLDLINYIVNRLNWFYKLDKIKEIVNNDKICGIEAKLMIKDILEGKENES